MPTLVGFWSIKRSCQVVSCVCDPLVGNVVGQHALEWREGEEEAGAAAAAVVLELRDMPHSSGHNTPAAPAVNPRRMYLEGGEGTRNIL